MSVNPACERLISIDHPALPGHFPGQPLVPAVLLIDTLMDTASEALQPQLTEPIQSLRQLRFTAPVVPGVPIRVDWQARAEQPWRFSVWQHHQEVCRGIASLEPVVELTGKTATELTVRPIDTHASIATAPLYRQLPHSGSMCLLDEVDLSAPDALYGCARLGREQPLLFEGCLSGWQGLEYAAQLLACQGAHMAGELVQARVVMARRLDCHRLPVVAADQLLEVGVQVVSRQHNAASCIFTLHCAGSLLADGEFTVMFG